MLTVDFTHLAKSSENAQNIPTIPLDELPKHKQMLLKMVAKHSQNPPTFATLPNDHDNLVEIQQFVKENIYNYTDIIQVGLGGSILGAELLVKTVNKVDDDLPKIHIVDNVDPYLISDLEGQIDLSNSLFIIVTKSGTTPETVALYSYFRRLIENANLTVSDHFIFITDPTKNMMRGVAALDNIKCFDIPVNVGGRFSVLSNAGIILALFAGVDVPQLLQGAGSYYAYSLESEKVEVYEYALAHYLLYQQGVNIAVYLGYSNKFDPLGRWLTQLISESLGKAVNNKNEICNVGLTPISAIGSSAQHSILQLMNEGPYDKVTTFIHINSFGISQEIPKINDPNLEYLSFHSVEKLLHTEMEATRDSLSMNNRPSITLSINKLDAYHLGSLIMFFEMFVFAMGELLNINVFDQPGVETSKRLVKMRLTTANT